MSKKPLSVADVLALADLAKACSKGHYVVFAPGSLTFPNATDNFYVIARYLCQDANGALLHEDTDLRDGYVWFTATVEHFVPVSDVLADLKSGFAVTDYPPPQR